MGKFQKKYWKMVQKFGFFKRPPFFFFSKCYYVLFSFFGAYWYWKFMVHRFWYTGNSPPPKDRQFSSPKTLTGVLFGGSHIVKIPVGKSSMEKIPIGKIPIGKSLRSSSKDRQFFFWLNELKISDFTFDYFIPVSIQFD